MTTRADRWWLELEEAELAFALDYAEALNTQARRLKVTHKSHYDITPGQELQDLVGCQGKVAAYVASGLALPTIAEFLAVLQGPDLLHYRVRTTRHRAGHLQVYDREREAAYTFTHYLVVLNQAPTFAIVGELEKGAAFALGHPDTQVRGGLIVAAEHLVPYAGPIDATRARQALPPPPPPRLLPPIEGPTCGATRTVNGGETLVCTRPPGHELPHGVHAGGTLAPYVTWEA